MKKHQYSFFVLLILATFIMAACSSNASSGEKKNNSSQVDTEGNNGPIANSGEGQNANKNLEPVSSDSGEESSSQGNTEAGNSESDVQEVVTDLPPIPSVQFGPGDAWFRPTNPANIQLAAGRVQLFEFSAVW